MSQYIVFPIEFDVEIVARRARGEGYAKIGRALGLSYGTIRRRANELELPARPFCSVRKVPTDEQVADIRVRLARNESYTTIAGAVGISRDTLKGWMWSFGLVRPTPVSAPGVEVSMDEGDDLDVADPQRPPLPPGHPATWCPIWQGFASVPEFPR
jgi:hypothetical protein